MTPIPTPIRVVVTLVLVAFAALAASWMWTHYQIEPWTRDGRVRADVVQVSPDVSGLVTHVFVVDNAAVQKGQPLFELDKPRYSVAFEQASAVWQAQAAALRQAEREEQRDRKLGDLVPVETAEEASSKVAELKASVAQAQAGVDAAKLNLSRTTVYASVDGTVANVELRPGDYLAAGHPALGLVDSASLHVDGYFEETKLGRIHVGDRADVQLVGDSRLLKGHVVSMSPGIEDRERGPAGDLLPNVNPTFSWVRLAQRIPVRIRLDGTPFDAPMISGRTATVVVHSPAAARTNKSRPLVQSRT